MNFSKEQDLGFIAQEVEQIYPELIHTNAEGYKSLDYARLTVILTRAIQEQQKNYLQDIKNLYHEADGSDFLSKTIYGDYYTVMGFYLRRMELTRKFGLEGRFPLLDYRLVEYTSRIPSNLKLDEKGQTKAIFHKVMAGVLPDEIVFRTDKLGHSVPFKNWLRHKPIVQNVIREHLTPEAISKRGIFENES